MAKKPDLPKDIEALCHGIIHAASVAAGGVGAAGAQLPIADNAVITPIQIGMIIGLAGVFGRNITKEAAFGVLKGAGAAFIGRGVSQILVGWVPGLGNVINTATAAGLTEAIGWMSVDQFYDEWLRDGHSADDLSKLHSKDRGKTDDEIGDLKQKKDEELCLRADEFINGEKDAKGNDKEDFFKLFNEMGYELHGRKEDDPLKMKYDKLVECLK